MITRGYTTCRFGQMHYREATPGQAATAPTLILLHQNPSSSWEYEGLMREMARDRRVVAFDTPGYGMSDAPPAPLSMTDYAAAFADAIDALGLAGPLDVYGFHTGTLLAAELAIARPDRIGRVAMTGIPMFPAAEREERLKAALDVVPPSEDGTSTMQLLRYLWDYAVGQRDPRVPLERAVLCYADRIRTLHRYSWAYQGVWSYDYERLALIRQPARLVQTHEDLLAVSKQAAALVPNMDIVELPELDRDIFEIGLGPVAQALRDFFI
jgi:pimeloyl-ACP methyl ester carboxylesterase